MKQKNFFRVLALLLAVVIVPCAVKAGAQNVPGKSAAPRFLGAFGTMSGTPYWQSFQAMKHESEWAPPAVDPALWRSSGLGAAPPAGTPDPTAPSAKPATWRSGTAVHPSSAKASTAAQTRSPDKTGMKSAQKALDKARKAAQAFEKPELPTTMEIAFRRAFHSDLLPSKKQK